MNNELMKKLIEEKPLTAEETLRLDEMLGGKSAAAHLVNSLPEDEPSLAWRSELNSKLSAMTPKPRKNNFLKLFTAVAVPAAAAIALGLYVFPKLNPSPDSISVPEVTAKSGGIEEELLLAHNSAEERAALPVSLPAESSGASYDWSSLEMN